MPQANITYDTAYNRDMANRVMQMEENMLTYNPHQYHPSPMGYRVSSFHNAQGTNNTPNIARDNSYSSRGQSGKMTGGGALRKYILSGNSPAYPPANLNEVLRRGGARGGSFLGDFKKGFDATLDSGAKLAKTASAIAPVAIMASKLLEGEPATGGKKPRGRPPKAKATKKGGNFFKDLANVAEKVAPIALPILTGLGRKASVGDKRQAIAKALLQGKLFDAHKDHFKSVEDLAKKVAPTALKLMTQLGKKQFGGSFNFGKFLEKVAKASAPVVVSEGKKLLGLGKGKAKGKGLDMKGLVPPKGRSVGSKKDSCGRASGTRYYGMPCGVGGNILDDAIELTKPLVRKGKAVAKEAIKKNAPKVTEALKKEADKQIAKAVGGGRSARANIVKKVMAEKGMKMIEASKYVKEHGLYKK